MRVIAKPTLVADWLKSGRSAGGLLNAIKLDMAQFRLQTLGVTVTEADVDKFIKESPERLVSPKIVKLRVIVVDSAIGKVSVDGDLKAGKTFAKLAETYSIDSSAKQGGFFGTNPVPMLPKPIQDAVGKLTVGQTSEWIKYGDKSPYFAKFLVEELTPEKKEAMTPSLREEMRRDLMTMRGRIKNDVRKMVAEARKTAVIEVLQQGFAEAYADLLKKTSGSPK